MKIKNCNGKEALTIRQVGGDFWILVSDPETGIIKFATSFEMKKPYYKTYEKVERLFSELKKVLVGQEET